MTHLYWQYIAIWLPGTKRAFGWEWKALKEGNNSTNSETLDYYFLPNFITFNSPFWGRGVSYVFKIDHSKLVPSQFFAYTYIYWLHGLYEAVNDFIALEPAEIPSFILLTQSANIAWATWFWIKGFGVMAVRGVIKCLYFYYICIIFASRLCVGGLFPHFGLQFEKIQNVLKGVWLDNSWQIQGYALVKYMLSLRMCSLQNSMPIL